MYNTENVLLPWKSLPLTSPFMSSYAEGQRASTTALGDDCGHNVRVYV